MYGAKSEAATGSGFNNFMADTLRNAGVYQKANLQIKQAQGNLAAIAEQIFEKNKAKYSIEIASTKTRSS